MTAATGLYAASADSETPTLKKPWTNEGRDAYKGESIVVLGGSGSVGQCGKAFACLEQECHCNTKLPSSALQFARLSGFSNIVVTASPANFDLCTQLGGKDATRVIDRSSPTLASDIAQALSGAKPKVVFDAVSSEQTQEIAWDILDDGGVLVLLLSPVINQAKYPAKHMNYIHGVAHFPHLQDFATELFAALTGMLEKEDIVVGSRFTPLQTMGTKKLIITIIHSQTNLWFCMEDWAQSKMAWRVYASVR